MITERGRQRSAWTTRLRATWASGPAVIEGARVRLKKAHQSEYAFGSLPGVATDLASVSDELGVRLFVTRHGLLHHGPDSQIDHEPWSDVVKQASAMRELRSVAQSLEGAARGSRRAETHLAHLREWLARLPRDGRRWSRTAEGTYEHGAFELARHVSAGLDGNREAIQFVPGEGVPWEPGFFLFDVLPRDLLSYAYYEFGLALVRRVPLATCEECQRTFEMVDKRMRFCESRCQQRRWRRDHAKKGKGEQE